MNNTPSRVARKNMAIASGKTVNGNPVPICIFDNGYSGVMYPARVASRIKCIMLPIAQRSKMIVIESLFLPTLFLIVYFDISASAKKIIGINIVCRNVL